MKQKLIKIGKRLAVAIITFILLVGVWATALFFLERLELTGRIIAIITLSVIGIAILYRNIVAGETITDEEIVERIRNDDKYHQYIITTIKEGKVENFYDVSCNASGNKIGFYYMIKRFVTTEPEVGIDILKKVVNEYEEEQNSKEDNDYASGFTQEINTSVPDRR